MNLHNTLGSLSRLVGLAGIAVALWVPASHAKVNGITGPAFSLDARPGFVSASDGVQLYNWGYGLVGLDMQFPGPTLIVNQGETVTVTLTNNLPTRTSIVFPGQSGVTASCVTAAHCVTTSAARLTTEVVPAGTVTYSFVAANPGTYTYHSGTQMDVQIEMGLVGALIVRPPSLSFPNHAYGHADTAFTPDREYLLMLSEIDPARHQAVHDQVVAAGLSAPPTWRVNTSNFGAYAPRYWFINGRTSPDTLAEPRAPALPNQPYNALVQMHPGDSVLLRVINMGRDLHPFHHHGNNTWTVARDGRLLKRPASTGPDLAQSDFTLRMVPGQTVDAIWRWTGAGLNWDMFGDTCNAAQPVSATNCRSGKYTTAGVQTAAPFPGHVPTQLPGDFYKPLPARLPFELELTYGEMYSGSPFLGGGGAKPVGAGLANATNGFFHMMHSHNEREIVNDGVFPGGMMTMVLIQPPGVAITE
jgi:manganese oxidase